MKNIRTKKDALARYKMKVAAAKAEFDAVVREIMEDAKKRKLSELRKKISKI